MPGSTSDRAKRSSLWFATIVCACIMVGEVAGGLWSNSLALLSDAGHMFMDTFSLVLSLLALHLASLPTDHRRTYGWHRAEVLAAVVNGLLLLGASGLLLRESYARFARGPEVKAGWMLAVALVGLAANGVMLLRLRRHVHGDLNVRSAFLHVVSDFASSLGVVVAAVIIAVGGPRQADAVIGALIAVAILVSALRVLRDALHILLEGVPRGVSVEEVVEAIRGVEGVRDIHHFHLWAICSNILTVSSHVLIDRRDRARSGEIITAINRVMTEKFNISDTTFQLDEVPEASDQLIEEMAHPAEPHGNHLAH